MLKKILFLLSIGVSFQVFAGPMLEITSREELDAYISKLDYNGVMLVEKDHKVLFKEAFGYKDLEKKIPLTVTDRFQIGSNTKQFVAASILKLQEEGRLSIEDSLIKYFPELPQYKDIKIKDILNHTAGIPNYTDQEKFWEAVDPSVFLTSKDILSYVKDLPLEFEVGKKWHYSNTGYILAGDIIKIVTGKSWDEYISENFLRPLQMTNSGYDVVFENASDVINYMMADGKFVHPSFNLSWASSAGALYSTLDDVSKWMSIYDESTLLSEASKKRMQTPLFRYGLGIFLEKYHGEEEVSHSGRTPGFTSKVTYLKKSKLKVIVFNNTDGDTESVTGVLMGFYHHGKGLAIKTALYPMTQEQLQNYVGQYASGNFVVNVFLKDGKLFLQPDGQPPYEMKPNDKDSFNLSGISGEEFTRDANGNILGIRHFQGESEEFFTKK